MGGYPRPLRWNKEPYRGLSDLNPTEEFSTRHRQTSLVARQLLLFLVELRRGKGEVFSGDGGVHGTPEGRSETVGDGGEKDARE